jgi:DNA-binding transcriptional regulator YhcF (GntR family)
VPTKSRSGVINGSAGAGTPARLHFSVCHVYHALYWYTAQPGMKISIDIDDPAPPFAQLIAQVKAAVQSGRLQPGQPLPSIRQLANDLALNLKTVAKAYRLLERDAVIQTRGYRGSFVHTDAKANSRVDLSERAYERLQETVEELRAEGVTDSEIRNAFNRSMNGRGNG